MWDLKLRKVVKTLTGHAGPIASLRVLTNGNLVSYSTDDTIRIWNPFTTENNLLVTIPGHGNTYWIIPFDALSTNLVIACSRVDDDAEDDEDKESVLRAWNPGDGTLVRALPTGLEAVCAVLVLSNDQIAIGTDDGTIKVLDLQDDSKTRIKIKAHDNILNCLLQLSNGSLVSAGTDGDLLSSTYSIKVWNFVDLSLLQHIETCHTNFISSLSVSQDETTLASVSRDKIVKIWPIIIEDTESDSYFPMDTTD